MAYLKDLTDTELKNALQDAIELQDLREYNNILDEMTRRIRED